MFLQVVQTLVRRGGITNYLSIACSIALSAIPLPKITNIGGSAYPNTAVSILEALKLQFKGFVAGYSTSACQKCLFQLLFCISLVSQVVERRQC